MSTHAGYTEELLRWVEVHDPSLHARFLLTWGFHRLRTYAATTKLLRLMERSVVDASAYEVPEPNREECRIL